MLQNFEMIQIMEELKLARKLPNMLLQIGLGPDSYATTSDGY